jgi:hypothetical protein
MMDRFNRDDKMFAFILSTRSGGLGINLVGADSVIFYDTDWNPAMDAQAQDRAHRIGQTRDVHIYRLVTEHTIEENILTKANQKREMNKLAIEEGNFSTEFFAAAEETEKGDMQAFFAGTGVNIQEQENEMSPEALRQARAAAEDESDRAAAVNIRKERAVESVEFDETKSLSQTSSMVIAKGIKGSSQTQNKSSEEENTARENAEFEANLRKLWKGDNNALDALQSALRPVEKYALRFREEIEPVWTKEAADEWRNTVLSNAEQREWDMEELQRRREQMEKDADESADMVLAAPSKATGIQKKRAYFSERTKIDAERKKRRLAGDDWEVHVDDRTQQKYWYHTLTHQCTWSKPLVLVMRDGYRMSMVQGFALCPPGLLRYIYTFMSIQPDVLSCRATCKHYARVADHQSLWFRVLTPAAEAQRQAAAAIDRLSSASSSASAAVEWGHNWGVTDGYADNGWGVGPKHASMRSLMKYTMAGRVFGNFSAALAASCPGQTICFSPGVHDNRNQISLRLPIRLIAGNGLGDVAPAQSMDAKHMLKGAFNAGENNADGQRRHLVTLHLGHTLEVKCVGTVHMYGLNVALLAQKGDKESNMADVASSCVSLTGGSLHMERVTVSNDLSGGLYVKGMKSNVSMYYCELIDSSGSGLVVRTGKVAANSTLIARNGAAGVAILGKSAVVDLNSCEICDNVGVGVTTEGGAKSPETEKSWIHNNNNEKCF